MVETRIVPLPPRDLVALSGDLEDAAFRDALAEVTDLAVPEPLAAAGAGERAAFWMAPDELLLVLPRGEAGEAVASLGAGLAEVPHLVADVSDGRVAFAVDGEGFRDVLAKLTPADLRETPPGMLRRTRLGQVAAMLWFTGETRVEVFVARSVADYAAELLANAARPGTEPGFLASRLTRLPEGASNEEINGAVAHARVSAHSPATERGAFRMAFELPDLPYPHDALASKGMSRETLEFHHDMHHKAYVDAGNKLIAGTEWENRPVEEIVRGTYNAGAVAQSGIFNNASQYWNHNQFWQMMSPETKGIPGELERRLKDGFGSVDAFKKQFAEAGAGQFGSGWAWLVADADGSLKVTKTENGVNPLCFGQTALLGCDVWEHSYYIDYRNKRPAYIQNFLDNLVDWENVASRLPS